MKKLYVSGEPFFLSRLLAMLEITNGREQEHLKRAWPLQERQPESYSRIKETKQALIESGKGSKTMQNMVALYAEEVIRKA